MPKVKQMLKPDTVLKNYWSGNAEFADLFNAVLFHGEQVIKPEELEEVDTEESVLLEHKEYVKSIQASRDSIKIRKKATAYGIELALLGLEHQEHIHYAMPLRVMGYDYGAYKKQYDKLARTHRTRKGMSEDEYLSRMKQTDKFTPVITLVVYYGEKPWDGAKNLHEMLDIPESLAKCVNDYKMYLVEARQSNLNFQNANNQDLFHLLEIILDRSLPEKEAKEKAIKYSEEKRPDKAVIMAVAGATNTRIDYEAWKGDGDMCTLFENIAKEAKSKGIEEGIEKGRLLGAARQIVEMGYDFGLGDKDILSRLQAKLDLSLQAAQEYLLMFGKQKA